MHQLPAPVVVSARDAGALRAAVAAEIALLRPHLRNAPAKSTGHLLLGLTDNNNKHSSA